MTPAPRPSNFRTPLLVALAALLAFIEPAAGDEVPFITSPDNVTLEMLNIAGVKRGDHVIDLGSGDGRIVILAARKFGATGLGVDIDPSLVRLSNNNAQAAGVAQRAEFREQDLFKTDISRATVITMYLLPEVNMQLRPSLLALTPGTRLVSHDWDMGDWAPDRTTVLPVPDKKVGIDKSSKVHLWVVPARVQGVWCGAGATLRLSQKYQVVEGVLDWGKRSRGFIGQTTGNGIRLVAGRAGELLMTAQHDDALHVKTSRAELALPRGVTFRRASGNSCG